MTRARLPSLSLRRGALALCAAGLFTAAVAAQGEWRRITPIDRGRPAMNGSQSPAPSGARRFIFEYDGDRVRVVHQAPVDAVVPTVAAGAATPGLFVDVRDAGEHTLARVAVPDAMSASRELFPEQHDQPIVRADAPKATGAFTVIVPMFSAADHVTLVRIATSSETQPPAPSMIDLISFTITNSGPL